MEPSRNAIALGTFDGVHPGHRAVLEKVKGYHSVVVTFREAPKAVLTGVYEMLMTPEEKCRALTAFGIDEIRMLDFSAVQEQSAAEFLDLLEAEYHPALISFGFDYRFGRGAAGDTELLRGYCDEHGIEFACCPCVCADGSAVSSTRIREWLRDGAVERANKQILGGFGFTAPVLHGDARGRTIGFPTLNQQYPERLARLKFGVYAAKVLVGTECYHGIANIGIRPTYQTERVMSETYLEGFHGDLYDTQVTLKPLRFLRPEQKFSSIDALQAAIANDLHTMHTLGVE